VEKIKDIFSNGLWNEIELIRILMERVDVGVAEQQEIMAKIMDLFELQQYRITRLEEEIKKLKKSLKS
jgi:hypothetical protein